MIRLINLLTESIEADPAFVDYIVSVEGTGPGSSPETGHKAYKDSVGVWTIGYGHAATSDPKVKPGLKISDAKAKQLLKTDLAWNKAGKKSGWGVYLTQIGQKNGLLEHSDYTKTALSLKRDFTFKKKWTGYQQLQYIQYDGQMTGTVDSLKFQARNYSTQQSFTYRKLDLIRIRQNLPYEWSATQKTTLNLLYRGNTMGQNPAYLIASTPNPTKFRGQIN